MPKKMDDFIQFAKEDSQRAKVLFFSESFKETYLVNEPELEQVYHQLLLGRNREQIFDEFLIYIHVKKPVEILLSSRVEDNQIIITVSKKNKGYAQGQMILEGEGLELEFTSFYDKDFVDGTMEIPIHIQDKSPKNRSGKVTLRIPRQDVSLEFQVPADGKEALTCLKEELLSFYLDFCKGKLQKDAFVTKAKAALHSIELVKNQQVYVELLRLHLTILQGDEAWIEPGFFALEHTYEKELKEDVAQCYYLYLKAFYTRSQGRINQAVSYIRSYYDKGGMSSYPFWMLCYLDDRLIRHPEGQLKQIRTLFEGKEINELLQFEICNLYGQEVTACKELGEFEYDILQFGLEHHCLLPKVWIHVNHLVKKEKRFYRHWLNLLIGAYEQTHIPELLQGICSLLIRGNCMSSKYHPYYEAGMSAGVQVIGLIEAYITTIPKGQYPVLNQDVLLYFTYNSSLSDSKKANLYANLVKNRWKYDDMYETYHPKIRMFLLEQLEAMKLNEDLLFLYHNFFQELCQDKNGYRAIGSLLFYQQISGIPKGIKSVVIAQRELAVNVSAVCEEGTAYASVLGKMPVYVFMDQEKNPYLTVSKKIEFIWTKKEMDFFESQGKCQDENHFIKASMELYETEKIKKEDIAMVEKVLECQSLEESYRHHIFEKLLDYYFEQKEFGNLREHLPMVHLEYVSKDNRSKILELLIQEEEYQEAMSGIWMFGTLDVAPEALKSLLLWALTTKSNVKDDTLLLLGAQVFEQGIYNNEIMGYLQKFYEGSLEFMVELWSKGKAYGLSNTEFLERILRQGVKEKNFRYLLPAFLDYGVQEDVDEKLTKEVLDAYVSYGYAKRIYFEDLFYDILGKWIKKGEMHLQNQWVYLDYMKDKNFDEKQKEIVKQCVKYQVNNQCILPILFQMKEQLSFPVEMYESTYIVYEGEKDQNYTFHLRKKNEKETKIRMRELVPGYYVCQYKAFFDDVEDCYLTLPRDTTKRKENIQSLIPKDIREEGRFFFLNRMLEQKDHIDVAEQMEEYAYKKAMIELLEENDDSRITI